MSSSLLLEETEFCFSSTLKNDSDCIQGLQEIVLKHGGKCIASITKNLTHYVLTEQDLNPKNAMTKKAFAKRKVFCISTKFLLFLKSNGKIRPSEQEFLLNSKTVTEYDKNDEDVTIEQQLSSSNDIKTAHNEIQVKNENIITENVTVKVEEVHATTATTRRNKRLRSSSSVAIDSVTGKSKVTVDKNLTRVSKRKTSVIKKSESVDSNIKVKSEIQFETKEEKAFEKGKTKSKKNIASVSKKGELETNKNEENNIEKNEIKIIRKGRCAVDHYCDVANEAHVYQEKDVLYDAMLNQTEIKNNNNKFYLMQVLQSDHDSTMFYTWFRWGRVGYKGQTSLVKYKGDLPQAISHFKSKFRAKTMNDWEHIENFTKEPGKYDLIARDYGQVSDDDEEDLQTVNKKGFPPSKLSAKVQNLIKLIFNTDMMRIAMAEIGYDVEKMPLGKLTKEHIQKGYTILSQISDELNSSKGPNRNTLMSLSSLFYTIIPHDFGFQLPTVLSSAPQVKSKIQMLESLEEIEIATNIIKNSGAHMETNPLDTQYESLNCQLFPVDPTEPAFSLITDFLQSTHAPTHSGYALEIQEIFAVQKQDEIKRFMELGATLPNHKLLWHGSRLTNYVGILSHGLKIAPPEAPVTGYMFGKGVYFADMVSKSANYCFTNKQANVGLILICQVALGEELEFEEADYDALKKVKNEKKHSTKGIGKTMPDPKRYRSWTSEELKDEKKTSKDLNALTSRHHSDSSIHLEPGIEPPMVPVGEPVPSGKGKSLLYNEYIVYDVRQVRMQYLIQVEFKYKR